MLLASLTVCELQSLRYNRSIQQQFDHHMWAQTEANWTVSEREAVRQMVSWIRMGII